jgi:hypothetical protein
LTVKARGNVKAVAGNLAHIELTFNEGRLMWRVWAYGRGQWWYEMDQMARALDYIVEELHIIKNCAKRALGET